MNHLSLSLAAAALCGTLAAQSVAPGMRVYGPLETNTVSMVDSRGVVVHQWQSNNAPGMVTYMAPDGTILRAQPVANGPAVAGRGGNIVRLAFDGTILWDYRLANASMWAHIDLAPMPNGNVLVLVWDRMTAADAVAAGRDPSTNASTNWLPDAIVEVQQTGPTTGQIVWEWHIMDHVVQDFDATKANFGNVAANPGKVDINFPNRVLPDGEWNHANAIDYDPVNDLILISSLFQDEFYLVDHSTTTAEAAGSAGGNFGKGGDILYRWGNPQAYRAGTAADQKLFFAHGGHFIPQGLRGAGNIMFFNNRAGTPMGQNYSSVVEIQLPPDFNLAPGAAFAPTGFAWEYTAPTPTNFYSPAMANAQRLPNGNTFICSAQQAWLFEVDSNDQIVWQHFPITTTRGFVFRSQYTERTLWSDTQRLSASAGERATFELLAGTAYANFQYVMLGSSTGTSPGLPVGNGMTMPLTPDAYTFAVAASLGTVFPTFVGRLDAMGGASADFQVPAIPALSGVTLHHAFAVVHPTTMDVVHTSNAVPLTFNP